MGRLSRTGNIYLYERTNDSGHSEVKLRDIPLVTHYFQRSQQSEGDKKLHLGTERKPRALEFNHRMTSKRSGAGTTSEALAVISNGLERDFTVHAICTKWLFR
ncbi:unnamed protein product [Calypogeia fissa]